jgi:hypothetical protein
LIAVTDRREGLIFRDRYTSIGLIRKGVSISMFDVCYCSKLRRESRYSAEAASGHVAVAGFVLVLQVILSLSPAELLITDTKFDHRTTLGDKMETAPNLMQLGLNSTLHACENCGASEFDANGMERYGNIEKTVLRYRGHKVRKPLGLLVFERRTGCIVSLSLATWVTITIWRLREVSGPV